MNTDVGRRFAVLLAVLLLSGIVYLGSVGPARRLVESGALPQDWYLTIYGPVLNAPVLGDRARDYARWAVSSSARR